jgi:L-ascorbate metabolism protein UlaG (beta-lactamase superfamily)
MKITKLVHSCVLLEQNGRAILLNPGIYSWKSGLIDVAKLPKLHAVIVTHQHADHLGEPFVKALVTAQPEAQWVAPADTHDKLRQLGVTKVTDQSIEDVEVKTVDHAKVVPFGVPVQNLIVHCFDKVTDPGDTHDFNETKDVLLLPVQAPWGTTIRAFELGLELKPKYLLPFHDWMWKDEWRDTIYDGLERTFAETETKFLRPVDGQPIEIDL